MDFVKDVAEEAGLVKVAIPIAVVLAIGFVWLKVRPDSKPPPAIEISRTIVTPPMQRSDTKPTAAAPTDAASPTLEPAPSSAAPRGPMGAEDVFSAVSASVARLQTFDASGRMIAQGSGVATGNSIVITNCHVVTGAARVTVKVAGTVLDGVVQVSDRQLDLAALRVAGLTAEPRDDRDESTRCARSASMSTRSAPPQGLELTLSEGLVSSLRQTTKGTIIQTTAPISPGSSGGGLFDASGRLIGIVTFQHKTGQNLNFALPSSWIFEMQDREASEDVAGSGGHTAESPQ